MTTNSMLPFAAGALILTCPVLDAVILIDSAGITATADNVYNADFGAANTLDGMTLEGFTGEGTEGPPARPAGHQNNHWITVDGVLSNSITFALGGTYHLAKLDILNTSNSNWNDRETDNFTIQTSSDDGATYSTAGAPITLQDYTLGFQEIPLMIDGVTHVRLNVTNDPDSGTNSGTADSAVGLNEVRFYQVPEPGTALFGLLGFALLARRRRLN